MAATQQLEFAQAMSDFRAMFPEMEADVIEAVLRANAGAVDATIDQLLSMGVPDDDDETPSRPTTSGRRWAPPLLGPLPADFLRPHRTGAAPPDEDERIALFLQNEEFMRELRFNGEFLRALDKDGGAAGGGGARAAASAGDDADFKERLKNMGKLSRKKFSQLSQVFAWKGNKRNNTAGGLLQEEHSDDEERHPKA